MDGQTTLTNIATLLRPLMDEIKAEDWEVTKDTMTKIRTAINLIDRAIVNCRCDAEKRKLITLKFNLEEFRLD